jgi:hypothetical protein
MMIDDDECRAVGGMLGKEIRTTWRKSTLLPLCPPQIPHDLTGLSYCTAKANA